MFASPLIISPAPVRRIKASETCAHTNTLRSCDGPEEEVAPVPLKHSMSFGLEVCTAGTTPETSATITVTRVPNSSEVRSKPSRSQPAIWRAVSAGIPDASSTNPIFASANPTSMPSVAISAVSVSSCRTTRVGFAPSAVRNVISRLRESPRASSKFATFVHAINRRNAAAPMSVMVKRGVRFPLIWLRNGCSSSVSLCLVAE